jgi:hypothetical protein
MAGPKPISGAGRTIRRENVRVNQGPDLGPPRDGRTLEEIDKADSESRKEVPIHQQPLTSFDDVMRVYREDLAEEENKKRRDNPEYAAWAEREERKSGSDNRAYSSKERTLMSKLLRMQAQIESLASAQEQVELLRGEIANIISVVEGEDDEPIKMPKPKPISPRKPIKTTGKARAPIVDRHNGTSVGETTLQFGADSEADTEIVERQPSTSTDYSSFDEGPSENQLLREDIKRKFATGEYSKEKYLENLEMWRGLMDEEADKRMSPREKQYQAEVDAEYAQQLAEVGLVEGDPAMEIIGE